MPTRRVGLQQPVHSFFSIRENPLLSVSSVFYFYQTTPLKYELASCAFSTPFGEQTVLPNLLSFASSRLCVSISVSLTYKTHIANSDLPELAFVVRLC